MKDLASALEEELQLAGVSKDALEELILDGKCRVTDLSCLAGMHSLTKVSLCNVGLASLSGFPSLPNLSRLILADNRIVDGLHHLVEADLPQLRVLSLAHNRISDMRELEPLVGLALTHLDLCECPVAQQAENYRNRVLQMFPALEVLDNLDREGIELIDDEEEFESDSDEEDSEDEEMEDYPELVDVQEPEILNLITDSEDGQTDEEDGAPEEIHVSVLAGPPIVDEKSDEDQDYVMPETEPDSDEASFESDEDVSVSHHFAAGASSAGYKVCH